MVIRKWVFCLIVTACFLLASGCNRSYDGEKNDNDSILPRNSEELQSERHTADHETGGEIVKQSSLIFSMLCRSSSYSFVEFSSRIAPGTSVITLKNKFGTVAPRSYTTSVFSEDGEDITYHYYKYPLKNGETCFVFYCPQTFGESGYFVEKLILYPSEEFDNYGAFMINPEDIP